MYTRQAKQRVAPWMLCAALMAACGVVSFTARGQSPDDAGLAWGPCPKFMPEGCRIAVLQGDPGKPNADIFFKVPPNSKLPLHWHSSAEHIVLVTGELHVTYEGRETRILKPGSYAYGPARHPHSGSCVSDVACVLFIAFEHPVDAIPGKNVSDGIE